MTFMIPQPQDLPEPCGQWLAIRGPVPLASADGGNWKHGEIDEMLYEYNWRRGLPAWLRHTPERREGYFAAASRPGSATPRGGGKDTSACTGRSIRRLAG